MQSFRVASNHCLGNNCSHICLLSSTRPEGYKCACPPGLVLDNNLSDCKGMVCYDPIKTVKGSYA